MEKTDVDACLKELAAWYAKNRREMLMVEFDTILSRHFKSEAEIADFASFLDSRPGADKFRALLREAREKRPQTKYVWVGSLGAPAQRFETPQAAGFYVGRWAARELSDYGAYQRQWFSKWITPAEIALADRDSLLVFWGDANLVHLRDLTQEEKDDLLEGIREGWDFGPLEPESQSLRTKYEGQKVTLNGKPAVVKSAMQGKVAVIQSDAESAETSWAKLHDIMSRGQRDFVSVRGIAEPSSQSLRQSPEMQVEVWYWKDHRYLLGAVPTPEEQKRNYAVMWRGTQTGKSSLEVAERMFMELNLWPEAYFSQADVIQKLQPHPHTSMSVGDILVIDGQKFLCQDAGWKEVGGPSLLYEPEPCEVVSPQYYDLLPLLDSVPQASFLIEPGAKEKKIDEALRRLKEGVESIQSSEVFRNFLITMSKFHQYSIGNQILIMLQRPGATHVAGFNRWKELGRSVMAGEKGIMILAPCAAAPRFRCQLCQEGPMTEAALKKHLQSAHPQANPVLELQKARFEAEEEATHFFKVVYVFDVSQTQGKPLPELEVPVLSGAANEELFAKALAHCQAQGVTVSFESRPGQDPEIKGEYFARTIWVRPEESRAQQLKTLLHEMAHHYTETVFGIARATAETIAESCAFVVGAHFGFDSGLRSFPYVAVWSQDKKVLDENLLSIRNVATRMIQALEGSKV